MTRSSPCDLPGGSRRWRQATCRILVCNQRRSLRLGRGGFAPYDAPDYTQRVIRFALHPPEPEPRDARAQESGQGPGSRRLPTWERHDGGRPSCGCCSAASAWGKSSASAYGHRDRGRMRHGPRRHWPHRRDHHRPGGRNMPDLDVASRRMFFETLVQLILGLLFGSISATVTPEFAGPPRAANPGAWSLCWS